MFIPIKKLTVNKFHLLQPIESLQLFPMETAPPQNLSCVPSLISAGNRCKKMPSLNTENKHWHKNRVAKKECLRPKSSVLFILIYSLQMLGRLWYTKLNLHCRNTTINKRAPHPLLGARSFIERKINSVTVNSPALAFPTAGHVPRWWSVNRYGWY